MAFDAAADRAAGTLAMLAQSTCEIFHQGAVAAAMAAGIILNVEHLLLGLFGLVSAEAANDDFSIQIVAFNLTVLAHNVNGAVNIAGLGGEGEGGRHAIVEAEGHAHVVTHIVVAVVDAAAVGAGFQSLAQGIFRRFQADHIRRPFSQNGLVGLPGIKAAVLGHGAVQAAQGSTGRSVLRREIAQRAKGGNFGTVGIGEPQENIQVVAAFLQDNGAGQGIVAPVSPDEGVGHVEITDVFRMPNGDDFSKFSGIYDLL